jgi:tetratricopeptide (TPR) repeat protein
MTGLGAQEDNIALIRARALSSAGRLAWFQADFPGARAHLEESVALFRQQQDRNGMLDAMSTLILVKTFQGELSEAMSSLEESIDLLQHLPDRQSLLPVITVLARAATFMNMKESLPHAWTLGTEAERLARAAHDKRNLSWALTAVAFYHYYSGNCAAACPYLEEGVTLFRELGDLWGVSLLTWSLGNIARQEGQYDEAWKLNEQSLTMQSRQNSRQGLPPMLESFAYLAIDEGQARRGAHLLAAAAKLRETYGSIQQPLLIAEQEGYMEKLRALLAPAELEAAWKEGSAMKLEDAISYSLSKPDEEA